MASSFKKVSKGGIKGWIKEELFSLLPLDFFEDPAPSFFCGAGKQRNEERSL
jgi:hypothetical protein